MRRLAAVVAMTAIVSGCSPDNKPTNAPTTTVIRMFKSDHFSVDISPPITQHSGCVACDQVAHPGCQNIDPDGSCRQGEVSAIIGCSWRHGERTKEFSLGSFDLRSLDRVSVGIYIGSSNPGPSDPEFLGTTVHGSTWYQSTNLSSFIGQNNVALSVKFHAQFQDGEIMAPAGQKLELCNAPFVYLSIDSVVVRGHDD